MLDKIIVEFSFEDILRDIISKKCGNCGPADSAEYWLKKLNDRKLGSAE
jgi:hypothetical protein